MSSPGIPGRSPLSRLRKFAAFGALCAALAGCGSSATPAPPKAAAPAKAETKKKVSGKAEDPEAKLLETIAKSSKNDAQATAILSFSESRRRDNLGPRAQVAPEAFRVQDLPLVDIPEPLLASSAPLELPVGEDAKELFVDWRGVDASRVGTNWTTVRVTLQGERFGRVKIGGNEAAVGQGEGGGVYVTCGSDGSRGGKAVMTPARWETLTLSGRTARYTVVDAWFDARTCKASVVRRTTIEARALPGGVLYGFRDKCPSTTSSTGSSDKSDKNDKNDKANDKCTGTSLNLIGPRLSNVVANGVGGEAKTTLGSFSRVSLPIRRGGGGSVIERVPVQSLREWQGTSARTPDSSGDVVIGVELVQTVDDPEPIAVSYVTNNAR